MLSRRQLLASAAAAGAVAAGPRWGMAQEGAPAEQLNALFDALVARRLRRQPEVATSLGLDKGALAWTKSQLSDLSPAAIAQGKALTARSLEALGAIDRAALSGMDAVNYDTVAFTLAVRREGDAAFDYGGGGAGAPYVLSQLTGAYQEIPDFLDTQHVIEAKADCDAYLSRLEAFARQMEDEVEVVRGDVARGVVPPDFIIDKALAQMRAFRDTPAAEAPLVRSLARRAKAAGVEGDYEAAAARLYEERVVPALSRQAALLEELAPQAVHDAGVWRLPKGEDYYAVSLKQFTTSTISPAEIHQAGLELVASLGARADALMKTVGYSKGTVGERYRAMYDDPRFHYPNTDAGKEALIEALNAQVAEITPRLGAYFGQLPKAPLEIRRVPGAIEAGAPGGYYNQPTLDGSRPGIYWINLRDTAEQPKFVLKTLTYHEGVPGHHLQLALANEAQGLPLIRKTIWFSGYGEGWALYAEQLAVEMGMYENDPLGEIGMLHDAMFRAVRLVVDSGMHDKRWSREQAIKYFVDNIGGQESGAVTEIERYVVWPGQACSYMVGKLEWLRLRDKARAALGERFDIRAFHDAGLLAGPVPLTVLERVIDTHIAAAKG